MHLEQNVAGPFGLPGGLEDAINLRRERTAHHALDGAALEAYNMTKLERPLLEKNTLSSMNRVLRSSAPSILQFWASPIC